MMLIKQFKIATENSGTIRINTDEDGDVMLSSGDFNHNYTTIPFENLPELIEALQEIREQTDRRVNDD